EDCARFSGFVAAVGAFLPQMCELPAALLRRAEVFVDDAHGAREEAGDLLRAEIDWSRVTPLEDVVAGAAPPPGTAPVVFKSAGQALWDLAACPFAWERVSGR